MQNIFYDVTYIYSEYSELYVSNRMFHIYKKKNLMLDCFNPFFGSNINNLRVNLTQQLGCPSWTQRGCKLWEGVATHYHSLHRPRAVPSPRSACHILYTLFTTVITFLVRPVIYLASKSSKVIIIIGYIQYVDRKILSN